MRNAVNVNVLPDFTAKVAAETVGHTLSVAPGPDADGLLAYTVAARQIDGKWYLVRFLGKDGANEGRLRFWFGQMAKRHWDALVAGYIPSDWGYDGLQELIDAYQEHPDETVADLEQALEAFKKRPRI